MRGGGLTLSGHWDVEGLDARGRPLWRERVPNGVVAAALTDLLQVYFAGGTPKPLWYVGLIAAAGYTADGIQPADTMALHPGWAELTTYSAGARPAWTPTIAGGVAANASRISLVMTAPSRIKGIFLASDGTKGGTAGTLWSTALLPATRSLEINQTQRLVYTVRAAGGS